jgi:hypothetical protein
MVGAVGFEPTISCSQSTCDARLRYTPTVCACEPHITLSDGREDFPTAL